MLDTKNTNIFNRFICSFFICFLTTILFAQSTSNIVLEKVPAEELTNNLIKAIQQDEKGFLWFGTDEGVFKYDGYSFKAFKNFPGDAQTISNNKIEFFFSENNLLWIGSWGGLSCIDINSEKIKNFPADEPLQVYAISPENDSVFWIGTSTGLFQFNKKSFAWKRISSIDKNVFIRSICDDKKNHLYITTHNGFFCFDKLTQTCKHYSIPSSENEKGLFQIIHKSMMDIAGNIWMTTWNAGLIEFNPQTKKINQYSYNVNSFTNYSNPASYDILQDANKNFWIANSENGLTIFNADKKLFLNSIKTNNETNFLDNVRSLFRDRSGIVWVGTENGIYKYDPHVVYLSTINLKIKPDKSFTNTQTVPLCILKDKSSSWWLGSYNGIFIFDTTTGHLKNYSEKFGIPKSTLVANIIQDSSGAIWLSAYNQLIRVTKNKQSNYESKIFKSANIQSNIYYLYLDNENRIWIGTHSEGVFRFDEASQKFISYPDRNLLISSNAGEIRSFYEISKDSVLVGGAFTGLLLLHVNENRFEKIHWKNGAFPTSDLSINSITENKKSIWIGTEYNGLLQSDKQFEKLNAYTFRNGLPSMNIYSIISGNRNKLWLLTAAGVVDFQPENNHITVYNQKDGVKNLSYLQCIAQDCNGTILFGDLGCVHILKSSQIISNNKPPNVFITGFKIFDKSYPINAAQTIHLNYNQNYFSFDFTALNYTQPELNKYAYKLEGLDKQWNDAGNRRYVSYVNLKEGTYVFKVKACNNEGVWNAVPATLTLIIQPPFWHEWWFYLLVCLLVISVAYFIYRIKINQLKIKQQLRNKIARDLHDDIGSTLSGINIFSKLALQKMYTEKNAAAEILQKISDRSERTMDALSDIVWSINTKNDDMQNVLAKMQEHLSETLEPQQIKYQFIVDENMQHIKPDMELRKELYLIFKEAICNASKYASCSFVNISLARKKDVCTLIIHDNGKGFDINKIVPGNGIHNMQHRAEKIKGSFIINSEINKGTFIQLQFHLT